MYNEALLKAIIENAIDGIIVIGQDGLMTLTNPSACSLFKYSAEELSGKNVSMLMLPHERDHHDGYLQHYKQTGQAHIIGMGREVTGLKKNGVAFPARLAVCKVKFNNEVVYAGIIHDISPEKEAEKQLLRYNNELEALVDEKTIVLQNIVKSLEQAKEEVNVSLLKEKELNQLKTRFISIASHEFRTPLSSIQLSASLIEHYYERLDKQKLFTHLNKIKVAVGDLTSILTDFLSIEKIENDKINPVYKDFDLKRLCEEVIESMKMQAKERQIIKYKHSGRTSIVCLDGNLLQHCLLNLVSNAIKYSPNDGLIELKTALTKTQCRISVRDNGIGVPEEDRQHLFEAFFRAENTRDIGGTGLGLNIVKRYTTLMNGRVSFESNGKSGAVFTLVFPLK